MSLSCIPLHVFLFLFSSLRLFIPLLSFHIYVHASAFLFEKFRLVFSNTNKLFDCVFDPRLHSHSYKRIYTFTIQKLEINYRHGSWHSLSPIAFFCLLFPDICVFDVLFDNKISAQLIDI